MSATAQPQPVHPVSKFEKYGISRLISGAGFMVLWTALLFTCAGTVHWIRGWIYSLSYLVIMLSLGIVIWRRNPALISARAKWRRSDTKRFDKIILPVFLLLTILQPAVAGLDAVRFRWSNMPFWTLGVGLALYFVAVSLLTCVLAVNPWAESTVRIQTDRGQQVVRRGPYRFVRHPMYTAMILMNTAIALMLGSYAALALGGVMAILLIVRTALEDRTLRRELPGYEDYTTVTHWRLLPGIW